MKIAFQMEALETQPPHTTSSFYLMDEARQRGYEVYHFTPENITLENDCVTAWAAPVSVDLSAAPYYTLGEYVHTVLNDFDIVWLRQHPPFDMGYVTSTYILDGLKRHGVLVTNDPTSVRNLTDKFIIYDFKEFIAPTIVTQDMNRIHHFVQEHKIVVAKPLYSYGSQDVIKTQDIHDIQNIINELNQPLMIQRFLPEVSKGKKRVLLFDGIYAGSVVREPEKGDFLTPAHVPDLPSDLTVTEQKMVGEIGAYCRAKGLHFVGLDLIGNYLIEANITCTGGISNFNKTYPGEKFESKLWDVMERVYTEFRAKK